MESTEFCGNLRANGRRCPEVIGRWEGAEFVSRHDGRVYTDARQTRCKCGKVHGLEGIYARRGFSVRFVIEPLPVQIGQAA